MHDVLDPWLNPVTWAVPFFLLFMGLGSLVSTLVLKAAAFFVYIALYLYVAPWAIYFGYGINLIFQFFVHTETIKKLPRPVEFVFNTPSHHRVHHGSDPIYLDRNYGGILIMWDRMFGTFQPELHRPTYGLTHPVNSYNLVKLQYGHYADLWHNVRHAASWRDRLGYLFMPPDWQPAAAVRAPETASA